jgi:hypothetical protein
MWRRHAYLQALALREKQASELNQVRLPRQHPMRRGAVRLPGMLGTPNAASCIHAWLHLRGGLGCTARQHAIGRGSCPIVGRPCLPPMPWPCSCTCRICETRPAQRSVRCSTSWSRHSSSCNESVRNGALRVVLCAAQACQACCKQGAGRKASPAPHGTVTTERCASALAAPCPAYEYGTPCDPVPRAQGGA